MASELRAYRIFIASPQGLESERNCFRDVIEDFNRVEAIHRGIHFVPVGWEETLETAGRPQELINRDLQRCDYFVLVLWDRWGSRPTKERGRMTSGTEEEFSVAKNALTDLELPMKQMLLLFKGVDPRRVSDPGAQLRRVLKFRETLEKDKKFICRHFDTLLEFERCLRMFLAKWIRDHEQQQAEIASETTPQTAAVEEAPTRQEITLARKTVLTGDGKALLNYGLFLMRTGRMWRARTVLEKALAQTTKARLDASTRPQVTAALTDLLKQTVRDHLVTHTIAQPPSGNDLIIQRYLAPIDSRCAYTFDRTREDDEQPEEKLGTDSARAITTLIFEFRAIGQDFERNGLLGLAEEVYRRCFALAQSLKSNILNVQCLTDLVIVLSHQRDYRAAEQFARLAVEACPTYREAMHAIAKCNLGLILLESDKEVEGRGLLESIGPFWRERIRTEALSADSSEDGSGFLLVTKQDSTAWTSQDHLAAVYAGFGLFHLYTGELALAEKHHIEAHLVVGLYSVISFAVLNNLGVIYHAMGNLTLARTYFEQALSAGPRDRDGLNAVQHSFVARAQVTHNWSIASSGSSQQDAHRSSVGNALLALSTRLAKVRSADEPQF